MADQEEEDLKMALRLSMQNQESPEQKRSKSRENFGVEGEAPPPPESLEVKNRRTQQELMAAAAQKRFAAVKSVESAMDVDSKGLQDDCKGKSVSVENGADKSETPVMELSATEANKLFLMVFGGVSKGVLAQWSNQGIRKNCFFFKTFDHSSD